jgi:glycosyltransferase involved in cell wall biosynthesis
MDPGIPIPPKGYGGIERIVALLAKEYQSRGFEVDILASEGSYIEKCNLYFNGKEGFPASKLVYLLAVFKTWFFLIQKRKKYQFIQNFGRLQYLLPILNSSVVKVMCYQREITKRNIQIFNYLPNKNLFFSGCSLNLVNRANVPGKWYDVHNGIDFSNFEFNDLDLEESPLIFLGRLERIKGCHTAIKVAKASGNVLLIAGNKSTLPNEIEYFENEIMPHIDDIQIKYIGEVDDIEKNKLLRSSKALLMPIEWEEPFGIVMIEAMACGTPVIAYRKGSVDEVIDQDITGYKVENIHEMVNAVRKIGEINRSICHSVAKERFDINIIASKYLCIGSII